MNNRKSAGLTSLLIVLMTIVIWYIFFNVGNSPDTTWRDNFNYLTDDANEIKSWFIASIASGLFSSVAAFIYFYKKENTKPIFMLLFILCIVQAIPAIWFLTWDLKAIYSIPVLYGYLAYSNPNKSFKL